MIFRYYPWIYFNTHFLNQNSWKKNSLTPKKIIPDSLGVNTNCILTIVLDLGKTEVQSLWALPIDLKYQLKINIIMVLFAFILKKLYWKWDSKRSELIVVNRGGLV